MLREFGMGVAVLAALWPAGAFAGHNSGGSAHLTWSSNGSVTNLTSMPADTIPLYLMISGAPDIKELGVEMHSYPDYRITFIPTQGNGQGCGTIYRAPGQTFRGDSTYDWGISYPSTDHSCVAYSIVGSHILGDSATVCLTSVMAVDSNGQLDVLNITGGATIQGGAAEACPVLVRDVIPHAIQAGVSTLNVYGANFEEGAAVSLLADGLTLPTSQVVVTSERTLAATVNALPNLGAAVAIEVTNPSGLSDTLSGALAIIAPDYSYEPHHVLVLFQPGVMAMPLGQTHAAPAAVQASSSGALSLLQETGVTDISMLTPTATTANLAGLDQRQLDAYVCTLADTNVIAAVTAFRVDTLDIAAADPDWYRTLMASPSDPLYGNEWWAHNTGQYGGVSGNDANLEAVWNITTGAYISVAVIDGGSDPSHPDLTGRVVDGPNFVTSGQPPLDDNAVSSHGTSVSGIIAAAGNGGGSIAGVNWHAFIVAIKSSDATGHITTSASDQAVDWARASGYKFVNISSGGPGTSAVDGLTFKNAYNAGMAVFVAMGNSNGNLTQYPAGHYPATIAVGASMNDGFRWDDHNIQWSVVGASGPPDGQYSGSSTGSHLRFLAPGGRFIETTRRVDFGSYWDIINSSNHGFSGTSAATPVATGVATLVESMAPSLNNEDIAQVLARTARDITSPSPPYAPGFDTWSGAGIIDAAAAVNFVSPPNVVEHSPAVGLADIAQQSNVEVTVTYWPGVSPGRYFGIRHVLQATLPYTRSFIETPRVWANRLACYGIGDDQPIDYNSWIQSAWVVSADSQHVTLQTYVYDLRDIFSSHVAWVPTTPAGARVAFTAVGRVSALAVEEEGSDGRVSMLIGPNPARARTVVRLELPAATECQVAVYDVGGRCVRKLLAGRTSAGLHEVPWDMRDTTGKRVKPGLYLMRMSTPRTTRVARVAVLN